MRGRRIESKGVFRESLFVPVEGVPVFVGCRRNEKSRRGRTWFIDIRGRYIRIMKLYSLSTPHRIRYHQLPVRRCVIDSEGGVTVRRSQLLDKVPRTVRKLRYD